MRGAQPSQSDRNESADRGFGRQTASCCEGVEAVARKLLRRDITPNVAGLCGLGQVSFHSLGTTLVYMMTISRHFDLITTFCLDKLLPS